ncbi:MAG: hypothetical protein JWM56_1172, partial [Candidatus Peribacteria bacterium]|nr:hypothetical protein [Candidatus Peribacteria bacterium]
MIAHIHSGCERKWTFQPAGLMPVRYARLPTWPFHLYAERLLGLWFAKNRHCGEIYSGADLFRVAGRWLSDCMSTHRLRAVHLWQQVIGVLLLGCLCSETCHAQVIINEVMWMGTDLSTADEWVELHNTGSGSANISGWSLTTLSSQNTEDTMVRFASGTVLSADSYPVIANYHENESRLAASPLVATTAVSLPNSKLLLRLRNASGTLMDEADDGVSVPFAGTNGSNPWQKASMERLDPLLSGTLLSNWRTARTFAGFDDGSTLFGTPGYANDSGQTLSSGSLSSSPSSSSGKLVSAPIIPPLRISEVLSNPAGSDDDEWIELRNTGSGSVRLADYTLSVASKTFLLAGFSGSLLGSGSVLVLRTHQTGLTLKNTGDTVLLTYLGATIDTLVYPSLPEGISYGRIGDANHLFCVPTEGAINDTAAPWQPQISIQSGVPVNSTKVTLNLSVSLTRGSLAGATCAFTYSDGHTSDSCNPPSHSFTKEGHYTVTLRATSYCGTTVEQVLNAEVQPGGSSKIKITQSQPLQACKPTAGTGAELTEFMPSPDTADDEWIELQNKTEQPLNLCGWALDDEDGGSKAFALEEVTIAPHEYVFLPRSQTKIALNDSGDMVRLLAPAATETATGVTFSRMNKKVIQQISFDSSVKRQSYAAREDGVWVWTPFVTPGAPNQCISGDMSYASADFILSALPRPSEGHGREWIELRNIGKKAVVFTGWSLETGESTGKRYRIPYNFLRSGEMMRFTSNETGLTLADSNGFVRLYDNTHQLVTVLHWTKTAHDALYESMSRLPKETAIVRAVRPDGTIRVDIFNPTLRKPVYTERLVALDGIQWENGENFTDKNLNTVNLLKALIENKNIELQFSSNSANNAQATPALVYIDSGEELQVWLLRHGLVTSAQFQSRSPVYSLYEAEADRAKLGMWSNAQAALAIRLREADERLFKTLQTKGLVLTPSIEPGVVGTGSLLTFKTNVPADIFVSVNTGSFLKTETGILVTNGLRIHAYALHHTAVRRDFRSNAIKGAYVWKQSDYSHMLVISEVYPSPLSKKQKIHDAEWLELRNISSKPVNLAGWSVNDEPKPATKKKLLKGDLVIQPHGYLALPASVIQIAMNNTGDTVYLYDPNNTLIDQLMYSNISKGESVISHKNSKNIMAKKPCVSDVPTPGKPNICYTFAPVNLAIDTDGDSLPDNKERMLYKTNPTQADTDADTYPDGFEVANGLNPLILDESTDTILQLYKKYLLKALRPTWKMYKTKGLTIKVHNTLAKRMAIRMAGIEFAQTGQTKNSLEVSVPKPMAAGSYQIFLVITDVLNNKIELTNSFAVDLKSKYTGIKLKKKTARKKAKAKLRYKNSVKGSKLASLKKSSVLDRLSGNISATNLGSNRTTTFIASFIVAGLMLFLIGLYLLR